MKKTILSILLMIAVIAIVTAQSKKELYETRKHLIGQIGVRTIAYFDLTTDDDSLIFETLIAIQQLIGQAQDVNFKIQKRSRGWEATETAEIGMLLASWRVQNDLMIKYIKEILDNIERMSNEDARIKMFDT